MPQSTRLFLFGDQTYDFVEKLRELLAAKDAVVLSSFLDQAHYVIRAEMIKSLSPEDHKASRSSSMSQLLQKYVDGTLNPAFQTALSCVCQLGCFIREFEDPVEPYPSPNDSYVLGVCTGSLAAAAVSCASSLSELLPLAVQTVLVAFRLGFRAFQIRCGLETQNDDSRQPWSVVFSGIDTQAAISAIKNSKEIDALPRAKQPWISATSTKAITISGCPPTLAKLLKVPEFARLKHSKIPIYVPSHNLGMFSSQDVASILETTKESYWARHTAKLPFLSSVTGKLAWVANFRGLVKLALENCLLQPIGWDQVEQELPGLLKSRGTVHVEIFPLSSSSQRSLAAALKAGGIENTVSELYGKRDESHHRPGALKCKLAIVGMSGRFPEAQNLDEFWDVLYRGVDTCKEVPLKRWDVTTHVDPTGKAHNKGATRWGCWLDFSGQFDPRFFSISPKEAPQMDPAQRMALMSTWEAMERAGMVADATPSTQRNRIGVFHGVTSNDWMETNTAQNIDTYFITGGNRGFIPGRINFCFEFSGPSYSNDTACSSSLAAIHLACNSLWRGDCDTAVAGGTNMIYTPDGHTGLDKGFFLSRTGNCKPFDDAADGYCRAEAVGTVLIKRLEDAIADHDPILGVILDAKTNHSAMSDSMTRPHVGAQIENMTSVLNASGIRPNDFSYIEMHGTGTQVGDAVEMESVLNIFAPNEKARPANKPLYVGSAKANVGHGEGVSGVTSLIKVLLMMKHDTIVPHCGIKPGSRINRHYPDLGARNVHIAFQPKPWPRSSGPRRVLINNFSAAGGNTALLVEDAPIIPECGDPVSAAEDPRDSHIIAISGHVGKSLKSNLEALLAYVEQSPDVSLKELAYTTTARRWHFAHRVSVIGNSIDDIKRSLKTAIDNGDGINRPKVKPKVLLAFTGQGSQYLGMGKQLYDAYPKLKMDLQQFDQLARAQGLPSFLHIYTSSQGNITELLPAVVQLAIACLEMAVANLVRSFGLSPVAVVGHSLGEYAALYAAGVCSASDTIYLVGKRAELLQERCQQGTHAMLAVRAERKAIDALLPNTNCEVACINGPNDTVLSGALQDVASLQRILSAKGMKCKILELPFAFHSAQVEPILNEFETLARGVSFRKPQIAIISPLLGNVIDGEGVIDGKYLARHCRETVGMVAALQYAKTTGLIDAKTIVVEVGPKPLLCGMIKSTLGADHRTFPTMEPGGGIWRNLHSILAAAYTAGLDVNWETYQSPFESAKRVLDLPTYGWDLKEYYIPYEGDWCLHRHKLNCDCADPGREVATAEYEMPTIASSNGAAKGRTAKMNKDEKPYPQISTSTTIQRVVEEHTEPLGATMTVETDMCQPSVLSVAQGHIVDGIPLVTPSLYADIAIQVGRYTMNRIRAGHPGAIDGIIDVSGLVVDNALIAHGKAPQLLRTTLTVQWPPKAAATTRSAKVQFSSYLANGDLETHHATCTVRFATDSQLKSLTNKVSEYRSRIQALRDGIMQGRFVRYNRTSGYKLMSSMAQFHASYKLLDDLVLDEAQNEATCKLKFPDLSTTADTSFAAHPAHVDAITQLAGFTMNAQDKTDIGKEVYVNHGWESFQLYQPLTSSKVYDVYTKMSTKLEGDLVHGDVIVLHEDVVIAFFKGLSLRRVPRKALQAVLQSGMDRAIRKRGGKPQAAAQISKQPPVHNDVKVEKVPTLTNGLPKETKSVAVPTNAPTDTGSSQLRAVMEVIAEESGVALEELTDDSNFIDMGIDSLNSMVIGSRMREDLGLNLAPGFSLFADCPTVKSLKVFMLSMTGEAASDEADTDQIGNQADSKVALSNVTEDRGVAADELGDDTTFADIGNEMDSSFSSFNSIPNVSASKNYPVVENGSKITEDYSHNAGPLHPDSPASSASSTKTSLNNDSSTSEAASAISSRRSSTTIQRQPHCRPTQSIVLQGLPRLAQKTLFLLPDGGGSASSYVPIPRLRGDIAVVGLNCPYARDPENMDCTHVAMIESFCTEIRRRQPQGPYHLGGWSSGGAFAYVTAEALVRGGDEVHSIIIIDAPVPQVMEKLPNSFYEHCNKVGLFANQPGGSVNGNSEPPPYLIPHFQAVVDVMLDYKVAPLETERMPKIGLVWAAETVLEEEGAPDIKGMHFMVQKRTNFGPDGWETVAPGAEFDIVKATGANHFTLMSKQHVHLISELIDRVMA